MSLRHALLVATMAGLATLAPQVGLAGDTTQRGTWIGPAALTEQYSGKTWRWKDGAGYFRPDSSFLAWSGVGEDRAVGGGQWWVGTRGRICFAAKWYLAGKESAAQSCFLTVQAPTKIRQRNVASGSRWYVLAHDPVQPGDEINQLVVGDEVTPTFTDTEKRMIFK